MVARRSGRVCALACRPGAYALRGVRQSDRHQLWRGMGRSQEQEVEVGRLLIAPARRGQGVRGRLVQLLLEQAAVSGLAVSFVWVVLENQVALQC